MIKLQLIGNLGKDCLVTPIKGKNLISFNVAHSEKYSNSKGEPQNRTTWVECAYWTDRTAVANYLKKGVQVYVEGYPEVRSFTRADKTPGAALTLRVMNLQLLGKAEGSAGEDDSDKKDVNIKDLPASGPTHLISKSENPITHPGETGNQANQTSVGGASSSKDDVLPF